MNGSKIVKGLQDALDGNFTRVEMGSQAWLRVDHQTRFAANAKAWALGTLNRRGQFHVRRVVWGMLIRLPHTKLETHPAIEEIK